VPSTESAKTVFGTRKHLAGIEAIEEEYIMHFTTSNQESMELGFGNYTCNWGTHVCGLYETERERDEIVMGFLHQGDLENDLQMYCPAERTREDFIDAYERNYPHCSGHVQNPDKFNLFSAKELYYPNGLFSPISMDQGLNRFYEASQKQGKRNIRATAEMIWAVEAIPGIEHLMVYESRLNYFIPGKPWISICLYNLTRFSGAMIMKVLQTHPFTISGGVIAKNPYFQNPDDWLRIHAPDFQGKQVLS
jgi:hypothetical protein